MKTKFLARKVKPKDLESILDILKNQIGDEYLDDTIQEFEDINNKKVEGVIVVKDEEVLGYACWRKRVKVAYLETIAVKQEYQGKGVGSQLLNNVIKNIKKEQPVIKILNVVTDADAKEAILFYLGKGFYVSGTVNDEFIPDVTQIHLSLNLEDYRK